MRKNKIIIVYLIILCSTTPFFRGCTGLTSGDEGFSLGFPFPVIAIYFNDCLDKDMVLKPIYIEDVNEWILLVDLVIMGVLLLLFMAKQKYQNILLRLKWGILLNTFFSWGAFAAMYIGVMLQSYKIFNIRHVLLYPYTVIYILILRLFDFNEIPVLFLDILMRLTFLLLASLLAIVINSILYLIKQNLTTQSS